MTDEPVRPVVRDDVREAVWEAVGRDVWDAVRDAVEVPRGLSVRMAVVWAVLEARRGR
jgi:hypothetical protein